MSCSRLILNTARAHLDLRLAAGDVPPQSSLESLQRFLFSGDAVPPRDEDGSVAIFSTSGEALECVEIARRIGAAVDRGVPFDQIAIPVRSPERYQPLVVEGLRRAGIPAHCTRGSRRPDVAGRSFLALLHCAEERLSASRFAEYLSLGQMPEDEEPRTPAAWERLLVDAAVIGGPDRWAARLDGLREEFHRRYREEEDEGERERLERRIVSVENLRGFALPVIGRLAALPERATWGEWIAALTELAEFTLREPERVTELLEELEPMSEHRSRGSRPGAAGDRAATDFADRAPKESRYGKVWVGAIEEARGMAFRRVFVPGVNEGLFPRPPAEDPLLLEAQRESLGVELRADDTELLRIAAACASEQFTLSFSRLDLLTGRERVPSFYAFAVHRAAGGPEIDVREFEARARSATRTRIGWPAPPDPADAIDDAEFDLATLAPAGEGFGRISEVVCRAAPWTSLRARWMRWHKPWKPADGLFVEEIGSDALQAVPAHRAPPGRLRCCSSMPAVPTVSRCAAFYGLRPAERPGGHPADGPGDIAAISITRCSSQLLRDLTAAGLVPVTERNSRRGAGKARRRSCEWRRSARRPSSRPPSRRSGARKCSRFAPTCAAGCSRRRCWTRIGRPNSRSSASASRTRGPRSAQPARRPSRSTAATICRARSIWWSGTRAARCAWWITRPAAFRSRGRRWWAAAKCCSRRSTRWPPRKSWASRWRFGRLYYSTIAQNYTAIDVPLHDWTRRRAQHVLELSTRRSSMASCPPRRARMAARAANTCPSAVPMKRSASGKSRRPN